MKQIAQNKRHGTLSVESVPPPHLRRGMVLVKNYFSVISAGTEKTSIDSRKANLLQRAKSQPDEVRKVIDEVKRTGLAATWKRIMAKLDSPAALGYSSAGVVIAVDDQIDDLLVGDRVACAGAEYAHHSDVVIVPRNLVARIPDGVPMEAAAYSTIGAIAMQGIRQASPTLGEAVVVIGLGLIGQITVQLLKANGCRVAGIDLDPFAIDLATSSGADLVLRRDVDPIESAISSFTSGYGADAVIITAGTKDSDPIELAGRITRERGRVVVVGATGMDVPRTHYYAKEIDIRLSRSYGPGRYDAGYENEGLDYPIGYVRWTENRNMQAFLQLLREGKIDVQRLTTHRFPVDAALEAYALIEGERTQPYVGIVLAYEDLSETELQAIASAAPEQEPIRISPRRSSLTIGFIGAGSFASGYLLPHLQAMPDVTFDTVCNKTGLTGSDMRVKFGFQHNTTDPEAVFGSDTIGTVFIATRHGEHAPYVLRALEHGQHVFVEKPLALNEQELAAIEARLNDPAVRAGKVVLLTGFNRRFAPLVRDMRSFFDRTLEPAIVHYYVNAGALPKDHWTHHPVEGGGRIVGEVCHFVDTIQYLTDAAPVRVHAERLASENEAVINEDNVVVTLRMSDGSLGVITYAANGDPSFPKERIVMSRGNATAAMNNFATLELVRGGKRSVKKSPGDKGHRDEVIAFMDAIRRKSGAVVPYESLLTTTRTTFRILDSLRSGEPVDL